MSRFSVEALFKGNDQVSGVISKIQSKVTTFGASARSTLAGVAEANAKIGESFAAVAHKAAGAAMAIGAAAGAGLAHIVHSGAEFEQEITNVGAVMGKSRSQIADLEKAAMSLGVTTQFSSTEVSQAMEMMARKGFDSEEILKGIPGVLDAIAASGQGMAEVATVVGSSIRGFGLDASEASHVANVLAFTAEKTGATITDMGTALAIAAPTAKTLGVSLEDTAAAVGLLQRVGIDSSTAGSSVATMLAKITKPSKEVAGQMTAMGIKFKDAKGDMLPFKDVLGQFGKASDKLGGNFDRMAFFAELVGLRGDKAALALTDMAKTGDFTKLTDGIKNVGDYAHKVATIRMDTTMGSWKLLTSTIEVLETKLFQLKSGALREVIDKTNAWVTANQDLIVTKVGDFIKGVADNMPKIVMWGERILKIVAVFMAFSAAVKTANAAMDIASFVAKNPYVALALAVVAAIALIVAYWPEISAFFGRLWASIKDRAAAIGGWFAELWTKVASAFMSLWTPVAGFFSSFWEGLKSTVRGWLDFFVGLWTLELYAIIAVVRFVVNLFRPIWEPVLAMFQWLWEGIKLSAAELWSEVLSVAAFVAQALQAVWTPVSAFFGWVWGGVKLVAVAAWDAIVTKAQTVFALVKTIWAPIAAFFSGLWDGIASVFHTVMDGIASVVEGIVGRIEKAIAFVQGVGHHTIDTATGGGDGPAAPEYADPQVVTPADRAAGAGQFNGQIAVTAEGGASARVVSQSPGGVSLALQPSGGL